MGRVPELKKEELNEEQLRVYNAVLASRGSMTGPFRSWLHSPELADRAQRLGAFVRYQTVLDPRLSELAILVTARFWDCQVEWSTHEGVALESGLGKDVIDAVRTREAPEFRNPDEKAVYDFATQLLRERFVEDRTFNAVLEQVGTQGVIELTALFGYYTLVAMTLNVFQVEAPPDLEPLLPDCPEFR